MGLSSTNKNKNHAYDIPKVIIFDWDDTICPSSYVDRVGAEQLDQLPQHIQLLFRDICRLAERCLQEASKHGEVIIITNSDDGWVKFSCERFFPKLWPVMEQFRIVSARTKYERFYPNQPLCWKAAAFAHEVNELYETCSRGSGDGELNTFDSLASTDVSSASDESSVDGGGSGGRKEVVSFGDSMEERTAVRIVAEQLFATPKSVMFIQQPTPMQIIGQLHMLTSHMKFVCDHDNALDLEISPEQAQRCAESYMRRVKKSNSSSTDHHKAGLVAACRNAHLALDEQPGRDGSAELVKSMSM